MFKNNAVFQNEEGFTWQELVIAIAITGVFAIIAGLLLSHSQKESRDLKRLADVKAIQHALELYFYDCNEYPTSVLPGRTISGVEQCQGSVYLSSVPVDPRGAIYEYIPCRDTSVLECVAGLVSPGAYKLFYALESNTEGLIKGPYVAVPGSFATR
jgi:type II secretory pathway pseudopilin PulG